MTLSSAKTQRFIDETGRKYGQLTVLRFEGARNGQAYFLCQCNCGKEVRVRGSNLRRKNTMSCGCSRRNLPPYAPLMTGTGASNHLIFTKANPPDDKTLCLAICKFCHTQSVHSVRKLLADKVICKCLKSTHSTWRAMKNRCTNPKHPQFKDYGGRGITISQRWLESFANFASDMGPRPEEKTIDRYPNREGNYEPRNCRWATKTEQAQNRRKRTVILG